MIDHVIGRPSVKFRRVQVLAVVSFWSAYLYRGNRHGPPLLKRLSSLVSHRLTAWQTVVITILWLYICRNFGKLVGLECPEPLAGLYTRSYFRATWVTTALDAGFWSAMPIKRKWARDLCSVIFTLYYLVCAEQADEKVRKVRSTLTVDHLRVSWNKGTTPYLKLLTDLTRRLDFKYSPRPIRIPRPDGSEQREPVHAWVYFNGSLTEMRSHTKVILDIPGGGFVAMGPRNHDDKLMGWACKTKMPVIALDYKKAPEHPYPFALEECFDVYRAIMETNGHHIGLSGTTTPDIIVSGDSAGGNLAVGMVLMILQSNMKPPAGLMLIYPALDMNIGNWMTDEQMSLIRDRKTRKTNAAVLRRQKQDYTKLDTTTPHHSDDEGVVTPEDEKKDDMAQQLPTAQSIHQAPIAPNNLSVQPPSIAIHPSAAHTGVDAHHDTALSSAVKSASTTPAKTRLAMSSMISYFNDRILTPEMMRAMIILYIGPHQRPDFSTDYFLSPLLAPESLLAKMPKTYFLTGERDPLVDDTAIFAGRIRQAKAAAWHEAHELGRLSATEADRFVDTDHVEVHMVPGISHGFLQFAGVFPDGWKYIFRCAKWMSQLAQHIDTDVRRAAGANVQQTDMIAHDSADDASVENDGGYELSSHPRGLSHRRTRTAESSGDEDRPLEMTALRGTGNKINDYFQPKRRSAGRGLSRGRKALQSGTRERSRSRDQRRLNRRSFISLASEELMGRRMDSYIDALYRSPDEPFTPPTP